MTRLLIASACLVALTGCVQHGPKMDPHEFGNRPIYDADTVQWYSEDGKDDTLCGIVSWHGMGGDFPGWVAWSQRDNWTRHHFQTKQEAVNWIENNWCKP